MNLRPLSLRALSTAPNMQLIPFGSGRSTLYIQKAALSARQQEQQLLLLLAAHKRNDNSDNILAHKLQIHEKFYARVVNFFLFLLYTLNRIGRG